MAAISWLRWMVSWGIGATVMVPRRRGFVRMGVRMGVGDLGAGSRCASLTPWKDRKNA